MEIELRQWRMSDAECLAKYANNARIAANVRNVFPHPYTFADARHYIDCCADGDESGRFLRAVVFQGEAVGAIGCLTQEDVHCKSGELGYWLGEPFWGRGIMTASVNLLCEWVFQNTDLVRVFALSFDYNIGSMKVLEKAGFQLEGILRSSIYKNGKIFDSRLYARLKE
jgi:ribosomal-protein-alanine N-acetyltransferase